MSNYDVIVIGAGPAGISAAIYLKRYNLNPLVISNGKSSLFNAKIENYYGIESISGEELFNNGIKQAKRLGIDVISAEVTNIEPYDNMGVLTTSGYYHTKAILLATGRARNKLNIKGANELIGKGISMCATCDGFFFRGKKIAILGSGAFMEVELDVLKRFTKDITIFTNGEEYESPDFSVVSDKIVEITGTDSIKSIKTTNNEYNIEGLFVALGYANALDFANHIGIELDKDNYFKVDSNMQTNVPGIFAAGDVIGGLLQVSKAVGDGAIAALGIKNYIKTLTNN